MWDVKHLYLNRLINYQSTWQYITMILEEHMKNTIKENYLNNIYSLTVPTTLLDWGVPDRAYQGRSFTPHRYLLTEPHGDTFAMEYTPL